MVLGSPVGLDRRPKRDQMLKCPSPGESPCEIVVPMCVGVDQPRDRDQPARIEAGGCIGQREVRSRRSRPALRRAARRPAARRVQARSGPRRRQSIVGSSSRLGAEPFRGMPSAQPSPMAAGRVPDGPPEHRVVAGDNASVEAVGFADQVLKRTQRVVFVGGVRDASGGRPRMRFSSRSAASIVMIHVPVSARSMR